MLFKQAEPLLIAFRNKNKPIGFTSNSFSQQEIIYGIKKLGNAGARVINMSFGNVLCNKDDLCSSQTNLQWEYERSQNVSIFHALAVEFPNLLFVQSSGNKGLLSFPNQTNKLSADLNGLLATALSDKFPFVTPAFSTKFGNLTNKLEVVRKRALIVGASKLDTTLSNTIQLANYSQNSSSTSGLSYPFILAPGGAGNKIEEVSDPKILSTIFNGLNLYKALHGTSMAAPHVTGVATLVLQANPLLKPENLQQIILDSAYSVSGFKHLDAEKAVQMALNSRDICPQISAPQYLLQPNQIPPNSPVSFSTSMTGTQLASTAFEWNFGDGSQKVTTLGNPNGFIGTIPHTFSTTGNFTVTITPKPISGAVCPSANTLVVVGSTIIPIAQVSTNLFNNAQMNTNLNAQAVGLDRSSGTLKLSVGGQDSNLTFPYIWVANSDEGTISKLNVNTGAELGRYRTGPIFGNPSRTTVDQDGNVWVGNRNNNTITKIGLEELGQCVDRNGNGVVDTSSGKTDVKAWTGTLGAGIGGAQDECVLAHVSMQVAGFATPNDIRLIAIDPSNNLFVGGNSAATIFKVNGATGQIIKAMNTARPHYGGLVDKLGNLWSIRSNSGFVQKIDNTLTTTSSIALGHIGYGIALDKYGKIWTAECTNSGSNRFSSFDPDNPVSSLKVGISTGIGCVQGIAADSNGDIFFAGSLYSNTVGHHKQNFVNGVFTGTTFVKNYLAQSGPTGVAVDGNGAVWATNYSSNSVTRIQLAPNPDNAVINHYAVGAGPYNYSDMTGRIVRTITNRQGTWEATFDAGSNGAAWSKAVWKLKAALPAGTSVNVFVKVADTVVDLGAKTFVEVANDTAISGQTGRYLRIKVKLTSSDQSSTPEVIELQLF
jgi:streptogramin lyase